MPGVDATERFVELVQGPEDALALDEAALVLAAHAQRGLDVAAHLAELDRLAAGCPSATLDGWRRYVYRDLGFAGADVDYDDPRNSFLDQVLARRRGIPITLAVVGMELGRRVGVRLAGVSMPGHFLLRPESPADVFVDPFNGGDLLGEDDCEARFRRVNGSRIPFLHSYLEPVGPRAILGRMLNNLRAVYGRRRDAEGLSWVLRLRQAIPGTPAEERAELGRVLAAAGRFREAAEQIEALAVEQPELATGLEREAQGFRARLN